MKSIEMRKRHLDKEWEVIKKTRERLETNFFDKKAKEAKNESRNKFTRTQWTLPNSWPT